jgi:hypothetical protein
MGLARVNANWVLTNEMLRYEHIPSVLDDVDAAMASGARCSGMRGW